MCAMQATRETILYYNCGRGMGDLVEAFCGNSELFKERDYVGDGDEGE